MDVGVGVGGIGWLVVHGWDAMFRVFLRNMNLVHTVLDTSRENSTIRKFENMKVRIIK